MNPAHLHLMLNHLPVVGSAFTLVLLAVALARKSEEFKRVSLAFLVLCTLLAVPAYLTGEPAEDVVKNVAGISGALIEQHEESAQWAFGAHVALGVLAVAGWFISRHGRPLPNWCSGLLLALALVVSGLMARTANLGGQIRHPEIHTTDQAPAAKPHRDAE